MHAPARLIEADRTLVQILDSALAEAARRGGNWIACRLGCTMCCLGEFPITRLDAVRLRLGLQELEERDPHRAAAIRDRAKQSVARAAARPGGEDEDEPCPALDPVTGGCELYAARPVTCRLFGPAIRNGDQALGVCELCYQGASDEQIAACEVIAGSDALERSILDELATEAGESPETTVAAALAAEGD